MRESADSSAKQLPLMPVDDGDAPLLTADPSQNLSVVPGAVSLPREFWPRRGLLPKWSRSEGSRLPSKSVALDSVGVDSVRR